MTFVEVLESGMPVYHLPVQGGPGGTDTEMNVSVCNPILESWQSVSQSIIYL